MRTVVYLIGERHDTTPVKIGVTGQSERNIKSRLSSIQTGSHLRLEVLATMPGGYELEKHLHKAFADYRMEGEWFKREGKVSSFLEASYNRNAIVPRRRSKLELFGPRPENLALSPKCETDPYRLFTPKQVWEMLHVCPTTFYNLVKNGQLKMVKLGRKSLVPSSSVDELLAKIGAR